LNDIKKLTSLQKEMADLEKKEQNIKGSLKTLYQGLKKDLGDVNLKDIKVIDTAEKMIKDSKMKAKKAGDLFNQIMIEIDEIVKDSEE